MHSNSVRNKSLGWFVYIPALTLIDHLSDGVLYVISKLTSHRPRSVPQSLQLHLLSFMGVFQPGQMIVKMVRVIMNETFFAPEYRSLRIHLNEQT